MMERWEKRSLKSIDVFLELFFILDLGLEYWGFNFIDYVFKYFIILNLLYFCKLESLVIIFEFIKYGGVRDYIYELWYVFWMLS